MILSVKPVSYTHLSKDNFSVPRGELTDSDWDYMRDWLRPVLLSFITVSYTHLTRVANFFIDNLK